jgi:hypothetical protein
MEGSDGHNRILGIRIGFLVSITSSAMQCSCKPLTIMCCQHWWPKEINIFYVLSMAVGRGNTINFNFRFSLKTIFEKELIKKKIAVSPES